MDFALVGSRREQMSWRIQLLGPNKNPAVSGGEVEEGSSGGEAGWAMATSLDDRLELSSGFIVSEEL